MKFLKIMAVLTLLTGFQVNANTITINLDSTNVEVGSTINVTLLANFTDMVDTIQFDFNFDTSLFGFVDGSATSDLSNDLVDYFLDIVANPTGVGIGYFTFADFAFGSFTLASFDLVALQTGVSDFSLDSLMLSNVLFGEDYQLAPVTAQSAKVPVPATLGLFTIALFGVMCLRRKA